jgi:hypothetical protein
VATVPPEVTVKVTGMRIGVGIPTAPLVPLVPLVRTSPVELAELMVMAP